MNDDVTQVRQPDVSWLLEASCCLDYPIEEVFAFFQDAHNLQVLTPDFLRFEVLTPKPIEMKTGALIDYRIRLRGIPLKWRTEITDWNPPHGFVDQQLRNRPLRAAAGSQKRVRRALRAINYN